MKLTKKFLRFSIVGVMVLLAELLVFNFVINADATFLLGRVIALIVGLSLSFTLNRRYTFRAQNREVIKQLPKFIILYVITIALDIIISVSLNNALPQSNIYSNIAVVTGIAVSGVINFIGLNNWVFKKKK